MTGKLSKLKQADLALLKSLSKRQNEAIEYWDEGDNLVLNGSAGTGKTFLGCSLGMECVLSSDYPEIHKLVIVRSVVPTRDIGFLPGSEEEKTEVYKFPYIQIFEKLFGNANAFKRAEANNQVEFEITSFLRGKTIDNAIVLVDEMQNCNGRELNTIMTRMGQDCRVIFAGDYYQSDFFRHEEKKSIIAFLKILEEMTSFAEVEFKWEDIVRSDMVRDFIMTKEKLIKSMKIEPEW
jgi:phosphate starvation-inducible PhoH-like protein